MEFGRQVRRHGRPHLELPELWFPACDRCHRLGETACKFFTLWLNPNAHGAEGSRIGTFQARHGDSRKRLSVPLLPRCCGSSSPAHLASAPPGSADFLLPLERIDEGLRGLPAAMTMLRGFAHRGVPATSSGCHKRQC